MEIIKGIKEKKKALDKKRVDSIINSKIFSNAKKDFYAGFSKPSILKGMESVSKEQVGQEFTLILLSPDGNSSRSRYHDGLLMTRDKGGVKFFCIGDIDYNRFEKPVIIRKGASRKRKVLTEREDCVDESYDEEELSYQDVSNISTGDTIKLRTMKGYFSKAGANPGRRTEAHYEVMQEHSPMSDFERARFFCEILKEERDKKHDKAVAIALKAMHDSSRNIVYKAICDIADYVDPTVMYKELKMFEYDYSNMPLDEFIDKYEAVVESHKEITPEYKREKDLEREQAEAIKQKKKEEKEAEEIENAIVL